MLAIVLVLSLAAQPDPPKEKELPEAAKKELKGLEGKWRIVKGANSTKEEELDPKQPAIYLVFKGRELMLESGDKKETLRISDLDPSTDPKCLDLIEKRRDGSHRTLECVYKIDGDTLRFAMHITREGKLRPVGFDKPTDPRTVVWTLKRVKE